MQKLNAKKQLTVTIFFVLIILSCCTTKQSKQQVSDVPISETMPPREQEAVPIDYNKKIIFSTEDLDSAKWYSPTEYPLKAISHEGTIYDNIDYVIKLPNYKDYEVVIWSTPGGDDDPYALCIVKLGIMLVDPGLNVAPHWSEPGNDENNYCKKDFKIYEDYTIRIDTDEAQEGVAQKSTKYYRINDDGEFYEIKIGNN